MLRKIKKYIEENSMIEKGDKLVLGVSGGADSVCLLVLLNYLQKEYNLKLYVVHINHGIRAEASLDADYVKGLCEEYGVPFYLFEEDIPALSKKMGMSEEEAGRTFRYKAFAKVAGNVGAGKIVTAHHLADQAETVLFHLVRGTNLSGMAGIRPVSEWEQSEKDMSAFEGTGTLRIIRPLLCVTKEEIVDYLHSQNVEWREDVTNQDDAYMRNRLRNQILPKLCEINDGALEHIAEFARCAAQHQAYFDKAVKIYMTEHVRNGQKPGEEMCMINREQLLVQDEVLARAVIYEMIADVCGGKKDLTKEHVQAVYDLAGRQSGRKIALPYGIEAKNTYENLIIRKCSKVDEGFAWTPQRIEIGKNMEIPLLDGKKLVAKTIYRNDVSETEWKNLRNQAANSKNIYTKLFDCGTIKDTLYVRKPESEDYFIMNEKGNRKKLSRYFIDCKIPEEVRRESIVVAIGHEVLWLLGGRRCENYRIKENTEQIIIISCEGENDGQAY